MRPSILFLLFLSALAVVPCLAAEEELTGPVTREILFDKFPEWQAVAAAYQPRPDCVDKLRAFGREVLVEIYLGTWCSDSQVHVNEFFKVIEMADSPLFRFSCTAIPQDKDKRAPFYQGKDIVKLPTFCVFVDGREIGRIVETPERSVEEDLVRILGL